MTSFYSTSTNSWRLCGSPPQIPRYILAIVYKFTHTLLALLMGLFVGAGRGPSKGGTVVTFTNCMFWRGVFWGGAFHGGVGGGLGGCNNVLSSGFQRGCNIATS